MPLHTVKKSELELRSNEKWTQTVRYLCLAYTFAYDCDYAI